MSAGEGDGELLRSPIWEHAAEVLLTKDGITYGSTILKTRIAELCRVPEPENLRREDGRLFIDRAAKERYDLKLVELVGGLRNYLLEEHQMLLVTDNRGGLKVVMPGQQTAVSMREMVQDVKQSMRKASRSLVYVNTGMLTDRELQARSDALSRLDNLRIMSRPKLRELSPPNDDD